jgi:diadenylate cyclase
MYRFLIIVQGTRAYQMLFGIVTLAFLWWFSQFNELYSLSWILQNFFDYLFIILIVLFQDQYLVLELVLVVWLVILEAQFQILRLL